MTSDQLTELALGAAGGDNSALDALMRHELVFIKKWVWNRYYEKGKRGVDADDIVGTILLHLLKSVRQFQGRSAYSTWRYRFLKNQWSDWHRKQSRAKWNIEVLYDGDWDEIGGSYEMTSQLESGEAFDRLLLMAPYVSRDLLRLRFEGGYEITEITGMQTELNYEGVRMRMRRGLAQIKEKLEASHEKAVFDRVV